MAEIAIIDPSTNKPKVNEAPKEIESENNVSAPVFEQLSERAIEQVVGIESDSDRGTYRQKVHTLLEYAKSQTEDHSPESLKWIIRSLELKLGTPPFAEKRVNYLARYAWLEMEESKLKKEKLAFEKKI